MASSYKVKRGDNIETIAKQYGFNSWKLIYFANCNTTLRLKRHNPNNIKEGDELFIPDNPVEAAQKKLKHLIQIKSQYISMMEQIVADWNKEYSRTKNFIGNVDLTAKVALILVDLGSIIKDGVKTMGMSGAELVKANEELAKSAIKFAYNPVKDVALEKAKEETKALDFKPNDGVIMALGKKTISFILFDWNTPSFWASKYTGSDIEKINRTTLDEINKSKDETIAKLNEKIKQTEIEIQKQKNFRNSPVSIN